MFIDIHVHVRKYLSFPRDWRGAKPGQFDPNGQQPYSTPQQLLDRYDQLGIQRAVILPGGTPECEYIGQSTQEVLELCQQQPRFIPFANVDPRSLTNSPDAPLDELLEWYKARGAKGVGEVTANMPFDDPMVHNLFGACEKTKLPLTFHIAPQIGGTYGLFDEPGLPGLERALQKFPQLIFLGHSQAFWAEMGPLSRPEDRCGYPKGPISSPGRVVQLMRRYPNLHGDLSAHSGYNALARDEGFAAEFMDEFQDRLYFGTDICSPGTPAWLCEFLPRMRDGGKITEAIFDKIARRNAIRLLGLDQDQHISQNKVTI